MFFRVNCALSVNTCQIKRESIRPDDTPLQTNVFRDRMELEKTATRNVGKD